MLYVVQEQSESITPHLCSETHTTVVLVRLQTSNLKITSLFNEHPVLVLVTMAHTSIRIGTDVKAKWLPIGSLLSISNQGTGFVSRYGHPDSESRKKRVDDEYQVGGTSVG